MRAVRSQREQELEQELVRGVSLGVLGAAELPSNLAELARPVGQDHRGGVVMRIGIARPLRPIKARSPKPAARELIFSRSEEPEGTLGIRHFFPPTPDKLGARRKGCQLSVASGPAS